MRTVLGYVLNMLPYMLLMTPLYLLVRWGYRRLLCQNFLTNWYHEAGLLLFVLFLTGLASQTIIPKLEFSEAGVHSMGYGGPLRINLIPFRIFFDSLREVGNGNALYVLISLVGNIGIFVPVGFFFALLWHKKRFLRALFGGAGISLFIELCQLPMSRATDIDDLILNTLGALFGYILYSWLKKIAPSFISRFEI